MWNNFANFFGWIIGIAVFVGWMSLVGSPHVVETSIGLVISIAAGFWVYLKVSKKKL